MKNTPSLAPLQVQQLQSLAAVMVPLDLGPDADDRVKCAATIVDRIGGRLIGVAARELGLSLAEDGTLADPHLVQLDQERIAADLRMAEAVFRRAVGSRTDVEWRSDSGAPLSFAAVQARAADLLVVSRCGKKDAFDATMGIDPADLVFVAGRPTLVVPPRVDYVFTRRVLVAWKDTREARRAVLDSLPILKTAEEVFVLAVNEDSSGAKDVCLFLARHGIDASPVFRSCGPQSVAEIILQVVSEEAADLIVCGAYGHARMREWIFGGVTRDLLQGTTVPCLMSH